LKNKKKSQKKVVVHIGREKRANKLSIIVERQLKTLRDINSGFQFVKEVLRGKGLFSYISSFFKIRKAASNAEVIHAHYSFTGLLSLLAGRKCKTVVSFMGDDVYSNKILHKLAKYYVLKKADSIIVKSEIMKSKLKANTNINVIPNGVDLNTFNPMPSNTCKSELRWEDNYIHVLFPSTKTRPEKNFQLAQKVIETLSGTHPIKLHTLENIDPEKIVIHLNAADIVFLTSHWEGSSNVTKEAMACDRIVVSTNVGDAALLFEGTPGCFLSNNSRESVQKSLEQALKFHKNGSIPLGRKRIIELGLDSNTIAKQVLKVYRRLN
tara:strand:+ start:23368 stop:24336 length:969 start_codon:yes stop_codon:yes gene_type:complete